MRSVPCPNWPTSRSRRPSPFQSTTWGAAWPTSTSMGLPPATMRKGASNRSGAAAAAAVPAPATTANTITANRESLMAVPPKARPSGIVLRHNVDLVAVFAGILVAEPADREVPRPQVLGADRGQRRVGLLELLLLRRDPGVSLGLLDG